jgi:hypothetical protein
MGEYTDAWSTKMNKATINSIKIKTKSGMAKQMILNEASGMISGMQTELKNLKTQYDAEKNIIPALRRNYDTAILAKTTQGICL